MRKRVLLWARAVTQAWLGLDKWSTRGYLMAQLFTLTTQQDFINLVPKRQAEMRSNHVHNRSEKKKLK